MTSLFTTLLYIKSVPVVIPCPAYVFGILELMEQYDVVIVGAGAAGLAAGKALLGYGVTSLCVVEATDYIGGRIKTSLQWDRPIELGAEFIHGSQTITAQIAESLGLQMVSAHEDISLIDENGQALDRTARELFYKVVEYVSEHGKPGVSVAEYVDNNPVTDDEMIKKFVKNSVADCEGNEAELLDSAAFDKMSAVWDYSGDNMVLVDGYQPIITHLSEGLDIKLNSPVQTIDQSDEHGVLITLVDGTELWAKRVILTCSLGVLKQGGITLIPELPATKRTSIEKLGMGNSIKYFVKFKSPLAGSIYQFADADSGSLQTVSNWWASVANPAVLVGYCSGKRAQFAASLPPERLQAKVAEDLSKIYGQDLSDEIEACLLSRWDDKPYVLGSYSHHPVGTSSHDREALAAPAGKLFWAGEATASDGGSYATVHGALASGYRAADEVLNSL